jgi:hypothetical protein
MDNRRGTIPNTAKAKPEKQRLIAMACKHET